MKYERIEAWLDEFRAAWLNKNLPGLAMLFSKDVEYWETPFRKLSGISEVLAEWQSVSKQSDINIQTELLALDADASTVKWQLSYSSEAKQHIWSGIYFIRLNAKGLCSYFYQVGEERL